MAVELAHEREREAELDGFEPIDPAGPAEVALEVDDDSLTSDSDDGIVADPVRRR